MKKQSVKIITAKDKTMKRHRYFSELIATELRIMVKTENIHESQVFELNKKDKMIVAIDKIEIRLSAIKG